MQLPLVSKLPFVFWLAIVLAIFAASCATTDANHPVNAGSSEPVKGATLLMDHSR